MLVTSGNPQTNTTGEKRLMMALNAKLDTRVGEMKERLDQLTQENSIQSNRLSEMSHCMNAVKETLQEISSRTIAIGSVASSSETIRETLDDHGEKLQQLAGTLSNSHDTLKGALECTKLSVEQLKENTGSKFKADLRELFIGEGNALKGTLRTELKDAARTICSDCAETVSRIFEAEESEKQSISSGINSEKTLALIRLHVKRHQFVVEGLKAKKESAFSKGFLDCDEQKLYMAGYHLSPGVYFKKEGQHVSLYPCIQLHKGTIDDVLQWPFKEKLRFSIKHPSQNKEYRKEEVPGRSPEHYAKPDKASNKGIYFGACPFNLDDLEREGYVADDKLRVMFELVTEN